MCCRQLYILMCIHKIQLTASIWGSNDLFGGDNCCRQPFWMQLYHRHLGSIIADVTSYSYWYAVHLPKLSIVYLPCSWNKEHLKKNSETTEKVLHHSYIFKRICLDRNMRATLANLCPKYDQELMLLLLPVRFWPKTSMCISGVGASKMWVV